MQRKYIVATAPKKLEKQFDYRRKKLQNVLDMNSILSIENDKEFSTTHKKIIYLQIQCSAEQT